MKADEVTFTVQCTMRARWVPHFLGLLQMMQRLGSIGGSRTVSFYSDGDGDFRPKFMWEKKLPEASPPKTDDLGGITFDAG